MKRWPIGGAIALLLLAILGGSGWKLHKSRSYQVFGQLIQRVETSDSVVALTFDDGPTPGFTTEVLEILGRAGVRATFFVVGENLERWPRESSALVEAGHELGNHSYSHRTLVLRGPAWVRSEVVRTDSLIRAAGYVGEIHFRPPYGKKLLVLPWVLSRLGTKTVMWDIEPESFRAVAMDPARLREHVLQRVSPGSIILLHPFLESRRPTLEALPTLIEELQGIGYRMVTVSELLEGAGSEGPPAAENKRLAPALVSRPPE